MKTLDVARTIYSDEDEIRRARKSRNRASFGIEQYTSAAYRFDTNEYFKKLVSNMSVRIYTRVLKMYSSNEESINHYAFVFLHRMCHFRLEQSFPAPHPREMQEEQERARARKEHTAPTVNGPLTLMYMLFNCSTLSVISAILNDSQLEKQRSMQPLLILLKGVVRCFFESSEKNRCIFVEALFQHPHPVHFIEKLDSVYEAQTYRPGPDARKFVGGLSGYTSEDEERELARARPEDEGFVVPDEDVDEGDDGEFDEADTRVKAVTKDQLRKEKATRRRLKAAEKEARTGKKAKEKNTRKSSSAKARKIEQHFSNNWSTEEDKKLIELHDLYAGMGKGAFQLIAMDSDLQGFGKGRTARDIEKRCIELELQQGGMISASDDELSVVEDATQPQSPTQLQSVESGTPPAMQQNNDGEDEEIGDAQIKRGSKRPSPSRKSLSLHRPLTIRVPRGRMLMWICNVSMTLIKPLRVLSVEECTNNPRLLVLLAPMTMTNLLTMVRFQQQCHRGGVRR